MEGRGDDAAGFRSTASAGGAPRPGTTSAMSRSICSPPAGSTRSASTTSRRPRGSRAARCSATTRPRTHCPGAISTRTSTHMRDLLADLDPDVPIGDALRTALLAFNTFDDAETARHRQRMRVILETAELQAYSMTMYAGWRAVVAAFVARRLGAKASDLVPADGGLDDARRRTVGLRALAGRRVGFAARGAGRCVRHGQRRARRAWTESAHEKILDWGVGVRAEAATIWV